MSCGKTFSQVENYCDKCGSKLISASAAEQLRREVTLKLVRKLVHFKGNPKNLVPEEQSLLKYFEKLTPEIKQIIELILDIPDKDRSAELITKCFDSVRKKDRKMQVEYMQETADFYPNNKFIWSILEGGYTLIDDHIGQAKCLERLVAIDPNDGESWKVLGGIYGLKLLMFEKAITCTKKALELTNENDLIRVLSVFYEFNVDIENAIKYSKLYMEKKSKNKEEKERLNNLLKGIAPLSDVGKRLKAEKK